MLFVEVRESELESEEEFVFKRIKNYIFLESVRLDLVCSELVLLLLFLIGNFNF